MGQKLVKTGKITFQFNVALHYRIFQRQKQSKAFIPSPQFSRVETVAYARNWATGDSNLCMLTQKRGRCAVSIRYVFCSAPLKG